MSPSRLYGSKVTEELYECGPKTTVVFIANEWINSNDNDTFDVYNIDGFVKRSDINKPVIIPFKKYTDTFLIFENIL